MRLVEQPFSLQHLPYGIVTFPDGPQLCVRWEDRAISLERLRAAHLFKGIAIEMAHTQATSLNPFLALSRETHLQIRERLTQILSRGDHLKVKNSLLALAPYPQDDPRVANPVDAGDYVDFYCSRHHAFRVGCLFRGPENALPEQYFDLPIGYHGRSSTISVSGQNFHRPQGITSGASGSTGPSFGPSQRLDYELEVGFLLRPSDRPRTPDEAAELLFGLVLLNDWSARDIQAFEYRPLGPFLGKSFATSVGAWVTPWEALEPWFQPNTDSHHPVLPHLRESKPHHVDLPLFAHLEGEDGQAELCSTNLQHLAWSAAQMVAHLSSNGTLLRAGDLIATGTISGPETGAEACLLERTDGGKRPLALDQPGVERRFLHDGDTVTLLGGHLGVGLAPCRARVLPSR